MVLTLSPVFQFLSDKPRSRGFVFSFFPLMWGHFPCPAYRPYPAARRDGLQYSSSKIRTSRLSASRPLPRQWRDPPWPCCFPGFSSGNHQNIFQYREASRSNTPNPPSQTGRQTLLPAARFLPNVLSVSVLSPHQNAQYTPSNTSLMADTSYLHS